MANIAAMRLAIAILGLACVGATAAAGQTASIVAAITQPVPLPRPRLRPLQRPAWAEPHSFREAAGPDFNSADVTSEPSACRTRLETMAAVDPMPRLIGPGACGGGDMVQLNFVLMPDDARIAVKPAPVLRCEMAEQLTLWVRNEAAPRVAQTGTPLRSVDTYDDYDCRGRNRVIGAKMSEHGKGNAVDVRSFTLTDGHVMELTDIMAPKDLRDALRVSACARFTTVLGPGSDGYHEAHIHLDLAERSRGFRICQWDVREPPPPKPEAGASAQIDGKPVPLPVARPANAPKLDQMPGQKL
jgi:hypothetical protein